MEFIVSHAALFIGISISLAALALVLVILALVQLRTLRYPFKSMAEIHEKGGSERALTEILKGVDENREFIKHNADRVKALEQRIRKDYSAFGLVKYNAFEDIGGNQSYSFCLLNDEKDGVIFTNLVGRNSTRGYALEIKNGTPSRDLSEEERSAFETALKQIEGH